MSLGPPYAQTPLLSCCLAAAPLLLLSGCGARVHAPSPSPYSAPAASAGRTPRFRDVAAAAGIRFTPDRTLEPPLDILQVTGFGGGFLDYDTDGWLDVVLVGKPRCRLLRNTRGGQFEDVTAAAGLTVDGHWMGCASADFDNDGDADLFLSGYRTVALFRNDRGVFQRLPLAFPKEHWGTSAVFLDYDRDGRLDLYVGCYVRFGPDTMRLCDFSGVKASCTPSYYDAQEGHLYRNVDGGRFQETSLETGAARTHGKTLGAAACDFNADGWQDLYLTNDGMPGDMFLNTGGRFEERGLESGTAFNREGAEQAGMGVDWGDADGDGRPDLIVTTFQLEPSSLYVNTPGGVFREEAYQRGIGDASVNRLGFGAKFIDADNDGAQDLFVANGHVQDAIARMQPGVRFAQPPQLFHNRSGVFAELPIRDWLGEEREMVGRAVAAGDYDRDGRVDLLVTNLTGSPMLLHNETEPPAAWLSLRLQGTRSPRDGAGAVVVARAGGRTLTRWATTGGGYLSCSDPRVHIGLGASSRADEITVRWPDGAAQSFRDVPGGRLLLAQGNNEPVPDR